MRLPSPTPIYATQLHRAHAKLNIKLGMLNILHAGLKGRDINTLARALTGPLLLYVVIYAVNVRNYKNEIHIGVTR